MDCKQQSHTFQKSDFQSIWMVICNLKINLSATHFRLFRHMPACTYAMPGARHQPSSITGLAEIGTSSCRMSNSYVCLLSRLKPRLFIKIHLSHKTSVAGLYKGLLAGTYHWMVLAIWTQMEMIYKHCGRQGNQGNLEDIPSSFKYFHWPYVPRQYISKSLCEQVWKSPFVIFPTNSWKL